jgi:hypothetical protein
VSPTAQATQSDLGVGRMQRERLGGGWVAARAGRAHLGP